jgi:hypothetical protein
MDTPITTAALERQGFDRSRVRGTVYSDRLFFGGLSLLIALTVLGGFGPSYFFRSLVDSPPPLTALMHAHGAAFSAWIVLLLVQSALVAADRRDLHRALGFAGVGLAALMMVLGAWLGIVRAAEGMAIRGAAAAAFVAVPLTTVIVFPVLFGAAVFWRKQAALHKRFVMIATLEFVPAAIARFPGMSSPSFGPTDLLVHFALADLFLLAILAYDLTTIGRPHRATVWGGAILVASQVGRVLIIEAPAWLTFAQWLLT